MEYTMLDKQYYKHFFYKTITPKIFEKMKNHGPYDRALFIECDNGFLIEFIEANEIHGIDDPTIKSAPIVKRLDVPDRVYDLVVLYEKDYATYSDEQIYNWIIRCSARIIAVVGTREYMKNFKFGKNLDIYSISNDIELRVYEFDERLRIYE